MEETARRKSLLPVQVACEFIRQALAGLAYAHDRRSLEGRPLNIVHRDISPQNIIVSRAGEVKVVDFGIADDAESAYALLPRMQAADLDLVFCDMLTYATSATP